LWTTSNTGATTNWGLGMKAGTSPSITALPGGGFQVAVQANTGDLWSVGTIGTKSWNVGMKAGSSPSITALPAGGYEIAVQTNGSQLWTTSNTGATTNTQQGMAGATSPSIAALAGGGWETAFQANTGGLITVGTAGNKVWNAGMKAGTSPSITAVAGGGYETAIQINTGDLWTLGSAGDRDWGLGLAPTTSPAIGYSHSWPRTPGCSTSRRTGPRVIRGGTLDYRQHRSERTTWPAVPRLLDRSSNSALQTGDPRTGPGEDETRCTDQACWFGSCADTV